MEKELMEQVTVLATETAVRVVAEEKELEKKRIADRRLRNTKLLLKNYRHLKMHTNTTKLRINELDELLVLDLTEEGEFEVQSILKSKRKTLIMLQFVTYMLDLYKLINEKRYIIITSLYIADEKSSIEELANHYGCTPRAIYKELNNAVIEISTLLFGIDSILG